MDPITNENGELEYHVDEIVDAQYDKKGKLWYKIRWMGFSEEEETWEPNESLRDCAALDRWEQAQRVPVTVEYIGKERWVRQLVAEFPVVNELD
ncbi:hypothetical protein EST38_g12947 [Candolleomyces aberdarensis]|uniref:Chromo domain-containing protein n=1 Tax=Candolleomyces aberdarensis TaxID=2316362 RepID=A0A4Q2D450_9AGAR|nr:hypothetical protein EST38_g12947 [Candolleomyces aberdarensis]